MTSGLLYKTKLKKSENLTDTKPKTSLQQNIKSRWRRLSSRLGNPSRQRRSLYELVFIPFSFLVKRLCTFSISSISHFKQGDHTTELYSRMGRTYTRKARTKELWSPDKEHRWILLARWCALAVIACMRCDGDKSRVIITPRSRHLTPRFFQRRTHEASTFPLSPQKVAKISLRNFANRSNSCVARSLCDSWATCYIYDLHRLVVT